jgi:Family of unknown function (DUF5719)
MRDVRRRSIVVLAVCVAALAFAANRSDSDAARSASARSSTPAGPEASDSALTSTWFCAAGSSAPSAGLDLTVHVANLSDAAHSGSINWYPTGGGQRVAQRFDLPPWSSISAAAATAVIAPVVSAVVEAPGSGLVVEHSVNGPRGSSTAPCASDASATWYLANGVTARDASETIAVFNPFPDDAVVDIDLHSEGGRETSTQSSGVPVLAGTTRMIAVGDLAVRRETVALSVRARVGRVIVDRVQSFDGTAGRRGVSLALAASATTPTWWFADGLHSPQLAERWHVYNPGEREAEVTVEFVPANGATPQPVDVTIPAGAQVVVDSNREGGPPANVRYSTTILSLNGVPIVAERSVVGTAAGQTGWASSPGAPVTARRWAIAVAEASAQQGTILTVHNPGTGPVRFSVVLASGATRRPVAGLQDVELGAAAVIGIRVSERVQGTVLPMVVEATGDIVVAREIGALTRPGMSISAAIPYI